MDIDRIVGLSILLFSFFTPSQVFADLEVILASESNLPFSLSPSKFSNSPSKFSNSSSKFSNSSSKFSNSSSKFENSPSKFENSKSGDRRLVLKKGEDFFYIGYYVWGEEGIVNFFSASGDRLFYSPPGTDAVFESESGDFSGSMATINENIVLAVTENGQMALLESGTTLTEQPQSQQSNSPKTYPIQFAHNDELFVVNGEKYEAKTYCLGWAAGNQVLFVEGSPNGVCTSAKLFNVDKKESCDVWCE